MRGKSIILIVAILCTLPVGDQGLRGLLSPKSISAQITATQVRDAIDDGILYLRREQNANGRWDTIEGYEGGVTALSTLALLNAGVSPDDPQMAAALNYLRNLDVRTEKTYAISLMTMVFALAGKDEDLPIIERNVAWLSRTQVREGPNNGGWGYGMERSGSGYADNSNSQFAVLALHEASKVGITVEQHVWGRAKQYWLRGQLGTGAWGYYARVEDDAGQGGARARARAQSGTGSMTCAGIAALIISSENFQDDEDILVNGRIQCCGSTSDQEAIERGIDWLAEKFSVEENPGPREGFSSIYPLYYLYGLERAGRLSGRRFVGDHDWYREGAERLVMQREATIGAWRGASAGAESDPVIATSFALLFLSKGKRPILISKYKHGVGSDWDRHPKGVHFLTREVESAWDLEMNWQSIDGNVATLNDLLSSPVLFISGKEELRLLRRQRELLREYIDNGGFIFAEACNGDGCDGEEFDRQFRSLMRELFPDTGQGDPLQPLPADHPVWFAERQVTPDPERPLLGIQACCRTSVIYCPANLSCLWKLKQPSRYESFEDKPAVRAQIDTAIDIGVNVLTYATNRELKDKLDRPRIVAGDDEDLRSRDVLTIPKLAHSGGSDDAPGAWSNVLKVFEQQMQVRVDTHNYLVAPEGLEILYRYPILFMHGRRSFEFTDEQRENLRQYFAAGGFLLADSICASDAFSDSFRNEIAAIFPDATLTDIPADHPMFSDAYRGFDLSSVTLNTPTRLGDGRLNVRTQRTAPLLEGIEMNGRLIVVFSKYDISCAMENAVSTECKGYSRDDAARIGVNVLLYALLQ